MMPTDRHASADGFERNQDTRADDTRTDDTRADTRADDTPGG